MRFKPTTDIYVQELGFFDSFSDGLSHPYKVGIVNTAGTILDSVLVPGAGGGRLDGPFDPGGILGGSGFRYTALSAPLHLVAGTTYAAVALITVGSSDPIPFSFPPPPGTPNPLIGFLGEFSTCCTSGVTDLRYPTGLSGGYEVNFIFTTELNPVPLPAALPLFATGLGVMGLLGWRRKRQGAAAVAA